MPPVRGDITRAALAVSFSALFWAGNVVAGRGLRDSIDPITLSTLRWTICLAAMLPLVWVRRRELPALLRSWRTILALGATGMAGFQTLVYVAVTTTTAINALLMLSFAPVVIMVASAAIGVSRPTLRQWLGSLVSLAGAIVLITGGELSLLLSLGLNAGDLWMLGAVACWAVYSLTLRRLPKDLSNEVALAGSAAAGILFLLPLLAADPQAMQFTPTLPLVAALLYIGLVASLAAFLLWSFGVARLGAARASHFLYLMPVFGAVLAVTLLGENIALSQVMGAVGVLGGVLIGFSRQPRPPHVPAPRP